MRIKKGLEGPCSFVPIALALILLFPAALSPFTDATDDRVDITISTTFEGHLDMILITRAEGVTVSGSGSVIVEVHEDVGNVKDTKVSLYLSRGDWECDIDPEEDIIPADGGTVWFDWNITIPVTAWNGTYCPYYRIDLDTDYDSNNIDTGFFEMRIENDCTTPPINLFVSGGGKKETFRLERDNIVWFEPAISWTVDTGTLHVVNITNGDAREYPLDNVVHDCIEFSGGKAACIIDDDKVVILDLDTFKTTEFSTGLWLEGYPVAYSHMDFDGRHVSFVAEYWDQPGAANADDNNDVFVLDTKTGMTGKWSDLEAGNYSEQFDNQVDGDLLLYHEMRRQYGPEQYYILVNMTTGERVEFIYEPEMDSWDDWIEGPLDFEDGIAVFQIYNDPRFAYLDVREGVFHRVEMDDYCQSPRLDNGRIVFWTTNGTMIYDIGTEEYLIIEDGVDARRPDIYGDNIVSLSHLGNGSCDVFLYEITDGKAYIPDPNWGQEDGEKSPDRVIMSVKIGAILFLVTFMVWIVMVWKNTGRNRQKEKREGKQPSKPSPRKKDRSRRR